MSAGTVLAIVVAWAVIVAALLALLWAFGDQRREFGQRRLHDGARMADQDADVIDLETIAGSRRLWQRQQDDIAWAKSVHPTSYQPPIDFAAHVARTLPDQKDDIA